MIKIKNPIHKRLKNLDSKKQKIFMLLICERLYKNFNFFCNLDEKYQEHNKIYKNILDLIWEYLQGSNTNIDFEGQLEKLAIIIPNVDENSDVYAIFPAIDACEALSELLHYLINSTYVEAAENVSHVSFKTIIDLLYSSQNKLLTEEEIKVTIEIESELDFQWNIYRTLQDVTIINKEFLKDLKFELRNELTSNIGI